MYSTYIFDLYGTLVDIHTDESKKILWEKLALFYGFYGASYTAGELQTAYEALTADTSDINEKVLQNAHEAHPEIQIEHIFAKLFTQKESLLLKNCLSMPASFSEYFLQTMSDCTTVRRHCWQI